MNRSYKIIVTLADIHIGYSRVSAAEMKRQLKKNFFEIVEKFPVVDGIFILGDTLHTQLSLNSDYSHVYLWFVSKVYKLARKKKATVIFIKGTESHDSRQLDNIKSYENNDDGVDFRVYDTVEEIILWNDYKCLILPDVRVKQLEDIGKYLETPGAYDLILGHGMIDKLSHLEQESENMPTKPYIYDVEKLIGACKGPVLFGHVHQYMHLRERFYYVGPFTMLERGWQDSGFGVIGIYDKDRTKYKVEHYINPDSAEYYEIVITKKILDTVPIDEVIGAIDDIVSNAKPNDLVTLRITRGSELESADKVMMIESRYQKDKRFSIVKKIKSKAEEERDVEHREIMEKYSYLMDESLEIPEIAYRYYIHDFKPTIADQRSPAALLTEADFINAFKIGD